ncbi:MAG: DUF2207 domain-containing protein [Mogibacterium sp.]|nr:DUF2207 domain-containing protein [Mogibacterium sp.]
MKYIRSKRIRRSLIMALLLMLTITITIGMIPAFNVYAEEDSSGSSALNNITKQGVAGGAFEVTDYSMNAAVGKDHTITVIEKVTVNIPDTLQRIDFAIPSGSFRMKDVNVEDVAFSSKVATEGSTVTILDPAALSVGLHTYTISYKVMEFADRDPESDLFYFSVLLPEWRQPIGNLNIIVEFPEDFPLEDIKYYAGQLGVQDTENRLTYETHEDAHCIEITGSKIPENFGITVKTRLEDGYWEGALDGVWAILAMILVMGTVTLALLIMWIIGGRDPKFKRTLETKPIEGVSPVELGYIFNSEMDIRDLVRLILYFGTKGYLRISEYEPKRYRLIRLKDPDGEEKLIRNAYNILFEDVYKGRGLDMDQFGERLIRIINAIKDDVAAGFTSKEMLAYTPLSRGFRIAGIVMIGVGLAVTNTLGYRYQYLPVNYIESLIIGILAVGLLCLLCVADDRKYSSSNNTGKVEEMIAMGLIGCLALYMAFGVVRKTGHLVAALVVMATICISAFLTVIMRARGKGNAALVMRFRQLRRFIYHPTPKELLENHLADDKYYYDMMLYALTFGAEESWAISFLTLDVPEPDWYSDDIEGHAFSNLRVKPTTIDYARDLRSFARTIETAYTDMNRHYHRR